MQSIDNFYRSAFGKNVIWPDFRVCLKVTLLSLFGELVWIELIAENHNGLIDDSDNRSEEENVLWIPLSFSILEIDFLLIIQMIYWNVERP